MMWYKGMLFLLGDFLLLNGTRLGEVNHMQKRSRIGVQMW